MYAIAAVLLPIDDGGYLADREAFRMHPPDLVVEFTLEVVCVEDGSCPGEVLLFRQEHVRVDLLELEVIPDDEASIAGARAEVFDLFVAGVFKYLIPLSELSFECFTFERVRHLGSILPGRLGRFVQPPEQLGLGYGCRGISLACRKRLCSRGP